MATKEELLSLLREQRDRLADEIDGVSFALQAGCSLPALVALLVPGLGLAVYATARAACASDSADGLRRRVQLAQGVIDSLSEMAAGVQAGDPTSSTWPVLERGARELAAAAARVNLLSDSLQAASNLVGEVIDGVRRVPDALPGIGLGVGAAAAGVAFLLFMLTRR